jgi:hypothetical protein
MAIQTEMTFEHQPSRRTKIVAFRLTPDDYERLNALAHARGMQIGEWCREISLKFSRNPEGDSFQQAITGEMIALKDLVMNVTYNFASGCRITPNVMTDIWKEAERTKRTKAQNLLRQASADQQGVPPPQGMREK